MIFLAIYPENPSRDPEESRSFFRVPGRSPSGICNLCIKKDDVHTEQVHVSSLLARASQQRPQSISVRPFFRNAQKASYAL